MHVIAEPVAQRAVQQVGARVVRDGRAPVGDSTTARTGVAGDELAVLDAHGDRLVAVEAMHAVDDAARPRLPLERAVSETWPPPSA